MQVDFDIEDTILTIYLPKNHLLGYFIKANLEIEEFENFISIDISLLDKQQRKIIFSKFNRHYILYRLLEKYPYLTKKEFSVLYYNGVGYYHYRGEGEYTIEIIPGKKYIIYGIKVGTGRRGRVLYTIHQHIKEKLEKLKKEQPKWMYNISFRILRHILIYKSIPKNITLLTPDYRRAIAYFLDLRTKFVWRFNPKRGLPYKMLILAYS